MKIAFLYLIYDKINQDRLWCDFFANEIDYTIYIHHSTVKNDLSPFFQGQKIIQTVPTQWGQYSIVNATLRLLREAYMDPDNTYFCLVSGSCIPVKPFSYVRETLIRHGKKSHFYVFDTNDCWPRCNQATRHIPREVIRKSSQWWIMSRDHVEIVLNDRKCQRAFNYPGSVADEHYFITSLTRNKADLVLSSGDMSQATTMVNWGYNYKMAKPADGCHPHLYKSITSDELDYLSSCPCLFARKFAPECIIPNSLILNKIPINLLLTAIYGAHRTYIDVYKYIINSKVGISQRLDNDFYKGDPLRDVVKNTILIYKDGTVRVYPEGSCVMIHNLST